MDQYSGQSLSIWRKNDDSFPEVRKTQYFLSEQFSRYGPESPSERKTHNIFEVEATFVEDDPAKREGRSQVDNDEWSLCLLSSLQGFSSINEPYHDQTWSFRQTNKTGLILQRKENRIHNPIDNRTGSKRNTLLGLPEHYNPLHFQLINNRIQCRHRKFSLPSKINQDKSLQSPKTSSRR